MDSMGVKSAPFRRGERTHRRLAVHGAHALVEQLNVTPLGLSL